MEATTIPLRRPWTAEVRRLGGFLLEELKPKGRIFTPFNVITAAIMVLGAFLLLLRFVYGLGSVTDPSQHHPWGLWIGFNVLTGVAFAGGAYVIAFMVYVLRLEKYEPIVRVTILNGFLAYVFYAGALLLDLGRPWNVINPIIGYSFGVSSVLFFVAWKFLLCTTAGLVEFAPTVAEWLGWERVRRFLSALTLGAVVLGITLSTLHQAGLGALFLMARGKVHPLWYSEFMPILFFVSSIFAGLSVVILEGSISRRVFRHRIGWRLRRSHHDIVFGLARIAAGSMFAYLFLLVLAFVHGRDWSYLGTGYGAWYLLETLGFVLIPAGLFLAGYQARDLRAIRVAAVMAMVGIALNRLNISIITFNWLAPDRFVPTWGEVVVTLAVICAQLWFFRWIVNRMPVLEFARAHEERAPVESPRIVRHRELEPWRVSVR